MVRQRRIFDWYAPRQTRLLNEHVKDIILKGVYDGMCILQTGDSPSRNVWMPSGVLITGQGVRIVEEEDRNPLFDFGDGNDDSTNGIPWPPDDEMHVVAVVCEHDYQQYDPDYEDPPEAEYTYVISDPVSVDNYSAEKLVELFFPTLQPNQTLIGYIVIRYDDTAITDDMITCVNMHTWNKHWDRIGSNVFNINPDNIGIGYSYPEHKLHVAGDIYSSTKLIVGDIDNAYEAYQIEAGDDNDSCAIRINSGGGAYQYSGMILSGSYEGGTPSNYALYHNLSNNRFIISYAPSSAIHDPNPEEAITYYNRFTITSDGYIGIGTASPDTLFHVGGDAKVQDDLVIGEDLRVNNEATINSHFRVHGNIRSYGDLTVRKEAAEDPDRIIYSTRIENDGSIQVGGSVSIVDRLFVGTTAGDGIVNISGPAGFDGIVVDAVDDERALIRFRRDGDNQGIMYHLSAEPGFMRLRGEEGVYISTGSTDADHFDTLAVLRPDGSADHEESYVKISRRISHPDSDCLWIQNTASSGVSGIRFLSHAGVAKGWVGYGNTAGTGPAVPNRFDTRMFFGTVEEVDMSIYAKQSILHIHADKGVRLHSTNFTVSSTGGILYYNGTDIRFFAGISSTNLSGSGFSGLKCYDESDASQGRVGYNNSTNQMELTSYNSPIHLNSDDGVVFDTVSTAPTDPGEGTVYFDGTYLRLYTNSAWYKITGLTPV